MDFHIVNVIGSRKPSMVFQHTIFCPNLLPIHIYLCKSTRKDALLPPPPWQTVPKILPKMLISHDVAQVPNGAGQCGTFLG